MLFWDYLKILWPVASVLTPLLLATGLLWLRAQFQLKTEASNERKRLDDKNARQDANIIDHETRLQLLEREGANPPSRHELSNELTKLVARTGSVETAVAGMHRELKTQNDYLQVLVEQGVRR